MSSEQKIAKNTGILMLSQLVTWGLTLLIVIILPRYLGADLVGKLHIANSLWAIVAILISFGMDTYIVKEVANRPERAAELFAGTIVWRILLFGLGWIGAILYLKLFNYPSLTIKIANVVAISVLIWQMISSCYAILEGLEEMQYISLGNILGKVVNTVVIILLILLKYDVLAIAAVATLSALVTLGLPAYQLYKKGVIRFSRQMPAFPRLLHHSIPYLWLALAIALYLQVDALIISKLVNDTVVGWYSTADQLFATLLFIPSVFLTALFPALSRNYENASPNSPKLIRKSFDLMLGIGVPIGLGILVISSNLMIWLYGIAYAPAGAVLAVFGIVLTLTYQNMLVGQFLIATNRQNRWAIVVFIATVVTFLLDLLLVPWCHRTFGNGAIGGAIAFVITEGGMLIYGISILPKGALGIENGWLALRTLVAGGGMVAGIWWIREQPVLIPVIVGAIIYLILALLLRVISSEDLRFARQVATSLLTRIKPQPNLAGSSGN